MTAADWLRAASTILAAGVGAWVAARVALWRWRVEMIGRRRAELAEEVLADFLRLRAETRHAISYGRAAQGDVAETHQKRVEVLFLDVLAKRYRFEAVFGREAAAPFGDIAKAEISFFAALRGTGDPTSIKDPVAFVDTTVGRMEETCRGAILAESAGSTGWQWWRSRDKPPGA